MRRKSLVRAVSQVIRCSLMAKARKKSKKKVVRKKPKVLISAAKRRLKKARIRGFHREPPEVPRTQPFEPRALAQLISAPAPADHAKCWTLFRPGEGSNWIRLDRLRKWNSADEAHRFVGENGLGNRVRVVGFPNVIALRMTITTENMTQHDSVWIFREELHKDPVQHLTLPIVDEPGGQKECQCRGVNPNCHWCGGSGILGSGLSGRFPGGRARINSRPRPDVGVPSSPRHRPPKTVQRATNERRGPATTEPSTTAQRRIIYNAPENPRGIGFVSMIRARESIVMICIGPGREVEVVVLHDDFKTWKPRLGDALAYELTGSWNNGRPLDASQIRLSRLATKPIVSFAKEFSGRIRLAGPEGTPHAFVDQIYVPGGLIRKWTPSSGSYVTGLALRLNNRKKQTLGWRAVTLSPKS